MQRFENLDAVSHFSQVGSAGQTGRAAADDGHFLPLGAAVATASPPLAMLQSPTKRSSLPIATGSPLIPRMQEPSHWLSCGHTRPHTDGSELS